jgi:hypothetical protein
MENDRSPQEPTVVVHDTDWNEDDDATLLLPVNGKFPAKNWYATNSINVHFSKGSNREGRLSRLDYFLMMYPLDKLKQ